MKYTKEDLMNTWGVVESKEHSEYIIKIADNAGLSLLVGSNAFGGFFAFSDVSLVFIASGCIASWGCKQITIPLPPKDKEWPQVGDEVLICNLESDSRLIDFNDEVVSVLALTKDERGLVLTISHPLHGIGAAMFVGSCIKKPKSKQDLLIEELHQKLLANNCSDEYLLACDIVQGKIEGLSYE